MIWRVLNPQGIAGLVTSLALGLLLLVARGETRHWRKQSGQFEQLYLNERAASAATVANYRAAADQARATDKANAERVGMAQAQISKEKSNELESRLASARALAERLRESARKAAADPGGRSGASVPGLPASAVEPAQAARQDGLSLAERLTATEQAIQLDELIEWVERQHAVQVNGVSARRPKAAGGKPPFQ